MRKALFPLLFAAAFSLASCGENGTSSAAIKSNLESKGYTAQVMNKTEAEARIQGVTWNVEIKDAVFTEKGSDILLAFVCSNIDDASAFVNQNISAMVRFAERYTENPKTGSFNNVAFTGSAAAVSAAGLTLM